MDRLIKVSAKKKKQMKRLTKLSNSSVSFGHITMSLLYLMKKITSN